MAHHVAPTEATRGLAQPGLERDAHAPAGGLPWRFTTDQYHRMADAGILHEDDRVELIDGRIVAMSPIGVAHARCVKFLNRFLHHRLPSESVVVGVQDPVMTDDHSELQPDLALLKPSPDLYGSAQPGPRDILSLIEVCDTTLATDRDVKLPRYAAASIAEVFIVDIQGQAIERYTKPVEGTYKVVVRMGRGEEIQSTIVPELRLCVDDVLGSTD